MKKIFPFIFILLFAVSTASIAQTVPKAKTSKSSKEEHTKADGKPDKRFKENKDSYIHLKKDGTPDKRYDENKKTGPAKKDGTADMRYKANKKK